MDATASLPGGLAEEPRKIDSLIQVGVTWLCSKTAWERPTHSYFMKIKKWLWNCVSPWILTEKNNTFPTLYVTVYVTSQNQPGKRGEKKNDTGNEEPCETMTYFCTALANARIVA